MDWSWYRISPRGFFHFWGEGRDVTRLRGIKVLRIMAPGLAALALGACGGWWAAPAPRHAASTRAAPEFDDTSENIIRELEDRVRRDPEDFIAYNKLCGYYLQRLRETGDNAYLDLAARAARASLAVLPAQMNTGGLSALAQVEYASHDFEKAREHAALLTRYEPGKSFSFLMLGDALVGALGQVPASRETVAWCWWQRGEVEFAAGDYEQAERYYREALSAFPDYFRALAAAGRVRAARGDTAGAIEVYERAVPVP